MRRAPGPAGWQSRFVADPTMRPTPPRAPVAPADSVPAARAGGLGPRDARRALQSLPHTRACAKSKLFQTGQSCACDPVVDLTRNKRSSPAGGCFDHCVVTCCACTLHRIGAVLLLALALRQQVTQLCRLAAARPLGLFQLVPQLACIGLQDRRRSRPRHDQTGAAATGCCSAQSGRRTSDACSVTVAF